MNKKILVACFSNPDSDPRPNRLINFLFSLNLEVDVLSSKTSLKARNNFTLFEYNQNKIFRIIKILTFKIIGFILKRKNKIRYNYLFFELRKFESSLKKYNYDFVFIHDLYLLPFIFDILPNSKVIFDAREYYPLEFENNLLFKIFESKERYNICKSYLPLCYKILTVSPGIVSKYREEFNVDPILFLSVPEFKNLSPSLTGNEIRMVHHGVVNKDRKLENFIRIVEKLDSRFSLDLYLVGNKSRILNLKSKIKSNRIKILPPIPYSEIVNKLNLYDVGFYYLPENGFNLKHALPNKFFEFIQARLFIVIGPSPEMAYFIKSYNCGAVSNEFSIDSMVKTLNNLTKSDIIEGKNKSNLAAEILNSEREFQKIFNLLY